MNISPDTAFDPASLVEEFLRIIMIPDPQRARRFVSPDIKIRFTGGRAMNDIAECSAFNATRYAWVKKRFERTEVVAGATPAEAAVYNLGTLYGEWRDGQAFEGNRYVGSLRLARWTHRADGRVERQGGVAHGTCGIGHAMTGAAWEPLGHGRFDYSPITRRADYRWPNGAGLAVYINWLQHRAFCVW